MWKCTDLIFFPNVTTDSYNFYLSTALAESYKFWNVVFIFILFKVFSDFWLPLYELFRNALNIQPYKDNPVV